MSHEKKHVKLKPLNYLSTFWQTVIQRSCTFTKWKWFNTEYYCDKFKANIRWLAIASSDSCTHYINHTLGLFFIFLLVSSYLFQLENLLIMIMNCKETLIDWKHNSVWINGKRLNFVLSEDKLFHNNQIHGSFFYQIRFFYFNQRYKTEQD